MQRQDREGHYVQSCRKRPARMRASTPEVRRIACGTRIPSYFRLPCGSTSTSVLSPPRSSRCPVASTPTPTPGGFLSRLDRIFASTSFSAFSNSSRFAILVDRLAIAPSCHNPLARGRPSNKFGKGRALGEVTNGSASQCEGCSPPQNPPFTQRFSVDTIYAL